MRTAVCCIIKLENNYLREFVEWYKNLGFDNIIMYDNNDSNGENIRNVIADYIDNGFVKVLKIPDSKIIQLDSFNHCIKHYGKDYDWIAFFDCDEHLHLTEDKDIKEFLNRFNEDIDAVLINWMLMDDNDLLDNDGRLLEERFTRICPKEYSQYPNIKENQHVKVILHTSKIDTNTTKFINPHFLNNEVRKAITADGKESLTGRFYTNEVHHDIAYLKHFKTKTITEYITNRRVKGAPDIDYKLCLKYRHTIDKFFDLNERTPEKESIVKKLLQYE